jgi:hypothetical protein
MFHERDYAPSTLDIVIRREMIAQVRSMMSKFYILVAAYPRMKRHFINGHYKEVTAKDREIAGRLCRRMQLRMSKLQRYEGIL